MSGDAQLLLMIAGLHLLGLVCIALLMIPALRAGPDPPRPPDPGSDDGWGRGRPPQPQPPEPPRGGIPLPDAEPPRARLREPGRFWEQRPARERRPVREPARTPERMPAR
jgi:hypothetical protein